MSITIHHIEEMDKYLNELKNIRVYIGWVATGKSYLCSHDDRFFDLDVYRFQLKDQGYEDYNSASLPKFHECYDKGMIVTNAASYFFMDYLKEHNIPFVYMYAKPELAEEYKQRMIKRGSTQEFIDKFASSVVEKYQERVEDNRATFKIEMNAGEYMSDYLYKIFGKKN